MEKLLKLEEMGIKDDLKSAVDRLDLLEEANNTITKHMNECVEEAMNFKVDESVGKQIKKLEKGVRILTEAIPIIKKIKEDADLNKDGKVTIKEGVSYFKYKTQTNLFKIVAYLVMAIIIGIATNSFRDLITYGKFNPEILPVLGICATSLISVYLPSKEKINDDRAFSNALECIDNLKNDIHLMKINHANELHDKDIMIACRDTEIKYLNNK
jgi:uncharacterized protein (UPF0335 family)